MGSKQMQNKSTTTTTKCSNDQTQCSQSESNPTDTNAKSTTLEMGSATNDQAIDLSFLPDDFPPRGLAEAIKTYGAMQLPFAVKYTHAQNISRSVYLTQDGERPTAMTQANLYSWTLNSREETWTLDLNGDRLIVKGWPNAGTVKGAKWRYHVWSPDLRDFEAKPIAFSTIGNTQENKREMSEVNQEGLVGESIRSTRSQSCIVAEPLNSPSGASNKILSVSITHRNEDWQKPSLVITFKDPLGRLRNEHLDRSVADTTQEASTSTDNLDVTTGFPASVDGASASLQTGASSAPDTGAVTAPLSPTIIPEITLSPPSPPPVNNCSKKRKNNDTDATSEPDKHQRRASPPNTSIKTSIKQEMSELWDFIPSLHGEKRAG